MKNYEKGLVSVVIPTYKRSEMLYRAIDSVCSQTYKNIEILVVNDNIAGDSYSLDLEDRMKKYEGDKRVILVTQTKHINGAAARNAGIRAAKGEYLAFLDDDDWWEPVKLEHQKEYLDSLDNTWGGVGCLMRHYKNDRLIYVSLPYKEGYLADDVMSRNIGIGTGSPLMRREAVDEAGYFDESLLRHQDIQFFSFFCTKYKMGLVKEYLYNYDLGDNQNRPSAEKIAEIKEKYYSSVKEIIDGMVPHKRKVMFAMNQFEIGYAYYREGNKRKGLAMMMSVVKYPEAMFNALKRVIVRWLGKKFANQFEKKYAY